MSPQIVPLRPHPQRDQAGGDLLLSAVVRGLSHRDVPVPAACEAAATARVRAHQQAAASGGTRAGDASGDRRACSQSQTTEAPASHLDSRSNGGGGGRSSSSSSCCGGGGAAGCRGPCTCRGAGDGSPPAGDEGPQQLGAAAAGDLPAAAPGGAAAPLTVARSLPTELLYEKGLELFDRITKEADEVQWAHGASSQAPRLPRQLSQLPWRVQGSGFNRPQDAHARALVLGSRQRRPRRPSARGGWRPQTLSIWPNLTCTRHTVCLPPTLPHSHTPVLPDRGGGRHPAPPLARHPGRGRPRRRRRRPGADGGGARSRVRAGRLRGGRGSA